MFMQSMKAYTKKIICLSKSIKYKKHCIAGKESANKTYGEWIRPISHSRDSKYGELSDKECQYEDHSEPQILDIISIPFVKPCPNLYQKENHYIDHRIKWKKEGRIKWSELDSLKDNPNTLWINPIGEEKNDRILEQEAEKLKSSLYLIYVKKLNITVEKDGWGELNKVRTQFVFKNIKYNLALTDPVAKNAFIKKGGSKINDTYLCVSLGLPFRGFCYKLVATVIYQPLLEQSH